MFARTVLRQAATVAHRSSVPVAKRISHHPTTNSNTFIQRSHFSAKSKLSQQTPKAQRMNKVTASSISILLATTVGYNYQHVLNSSIIAGCSAVEGSSSTSSSFFKYDFTSIDQLYDEGKFEDTLQLLNKIDESKRTFEWYWRAARTNFNIQENNPSLKKKEKKDFIDEGYRLIQIAEELNPNSNDVQRWKGILWNEYNSKISTKQKIKYLQKVKECWLRAVEINPKDATAFHLLGRWEYGLYSIDWFSRNIAKALFGTLPTSSVENAYNYFKEAENINPGFWLNNKLQLANMCMLHKDDKKEEAKKHYVEALKMKTITEEDKKSLVEVKEKLKKHFPDVFADHIKVEK
jgi:hypothetical protein